MLQSIKNKIPSPVSSYVQVSISLLNPAICTIVQKRFDCSKKTCTIIVKTKLFDHKKID